MGHSLLTKISSHNCRTS